MNILSRRIFGSLSKSSPVLAETVMGNIFGGSSKAPISGNSGSDGNIGGGGWYRQRRN